MTGGFHSIQVPSEHAVAYPPGSPSTNEVCSWGGPRIRSCKHWDLEVFGLGGLGAMFKH